MAITYLSSPIKSTVKPLMDNAELIAQVAAQKQNKYDNVLNAIFQRENQLLNLDIINEERNNIKNELVKKADDELNTMAKLDFLNPENITRAERLFDPIINNNMVMEGVYWTKGIRENQRFAQEALKKDPSPGNQLNYRVSQSLVDAHRVAKGDKAYDTAPYTTMFASYIDIKDKKAKFLKDYGILEGVDYKVTEDINGEKIIISHGQVFKEDEVLAAFNASLTAADRHQLVLDGYSQFNSPNLDGLMQNIKTQSDDTIKIVDKKMGIVNNNIKTFDSNGDGIMDENWLKSPLANDYQRQFQSLLQAKDYYKQLSNGAKKNIEYVDVYNQNNKDLPTGYKLQMFGDLATRQVAADFVTLFAHPDGKKMEYEYSNKALFDLTAKAARAAGKKEKPKKPEPEAILVDINGDGQYQEGVDILLPGGVGYTVGPNPLTEEDLANKQDIAPLKNLDITLKDGSVINAKILDPEIKNYQGYLHRAFGNTAETNRIAFEKGLKGLAYDPSKGGVDELKYNQIKADFGQYETQRKLFKDDKDKLAQLQEDWKDRNGQAFELAYQFKTNFEGTGDISAIDKTITEYVMNQKGDDGKTFKEQFENLKKGVFTVGDALTREDFIELYYPKSLNERGYKYPTPEFKNQLESIGQIYDKIKNVTLDKNENYHSFIKKTIRLAGGDFYSIMNPETGIGVVQIQDVLLKKLKDRPNNVATAYAKKTQELFGQLVDENSPLTIKFHAYDTKEQKADEFYQKVRTAFKSNLTNVETSILKDGKYTPLESEEKDKLKDIKFDDIELKSYNTRSGEVIASVKGISQDIKIKLSDYDAKNGLPFGTQVDDFVGKTLMLEAIINKRKPGGFGISKSIPITDAIGNTYNIACNIDLPQSNKFFIYKKDINVPIITGASIPELEGKLLSQFAKMGISPSVKGTLDILSETQNDLNEMFGKRGITDYSKLLLQDESPVINVNVENIAGQ